MEDNSLFTLPSLVGSLIVVAIMIALLIFIKGYLIKKVAYRNRKEHSNTFQGLLFNLFQYIVIIGGIFAILTVNGIKISGLLASLGIAATVVGLSLQDTFKDLFAGINIYSNNFYKVGDYVKYNGEVCIVKFFNARITKFRSIATGSTYTVSNSTINSIEKIKRATSLMFEFDFDVDKKLIDESLQVVAKEMEDREDCSDVFYLSLVSITEQGVKYGIAFSGNPEDQMMIRLKAYQTAYEEFKKRGIAPQFDSDRDVVISDKHRNYYQKKTNKKAKH